MERITIFDTTLRDGEQSPGCSMNVVEKLRMARLLDRLGVDVIEAGFPISSDGDFVAVHSIATSIRRPIITALARACPSDIQRAWEAVSPSEQPRIHVFLATSDIHLKYKLRITREQCLEQAAAAVKLACSLCPDVEFSPEDATRSDPDFLCQVVEAVVEAGAATINIPDTVGYATPTEFAALIRAIRERISGSNTVISAHCHNDLGLAVANTLAAVSAGARQVECTINGIGERAGNAALEEIVMAMHVRADQIGVETSVRTEQLYPTSQLLREITGVAVQPNKAIVGRNAFAHEAGIHQDGVLKNPLTYEIMTPKSVGVPDSTLVLGKHSGRHALGIRYEKLGYSFDRRQLDELYRKFVALADVVKQVEDHHLLALISDEQPAAACIVAVEKKAAAFAADASGASHRIGSSYRQPPRFSDAAAAVRASDSRGDGEDYFWGV